jgi:hypothetical protein
MPTACVSFDDPASPLTAPLPARARPCSSRLALGAGASYAIFTLASKRLLDAGAAVEGVMAGVFTLGALMLVLVLIVGDIDWVASTDGLAMAVWLAPCRLPARTSCSRPGCADCRRARWPRHDDVSERRRTMLRAATRG